MKKISVVTPIFNESSCIESFFRKICGVFESLNYELEFVAVDDGSRDSSLEKLREQEGKIPLKILSFSKNFGKESALSAGIEASDGDAAIFMDADLQHPPEAIPEFIKKWEGGSRIVHGKKISRGKEGWFYKLFANTFYRMFEILVGFPMKDHSDFKLLDREVLDVLKKLPEKERFFRGLTCWVGFPQTEVFFETKERFSGRGKWSIFMLLKYSAKNIIIFSNVPLYLIFLFGSVITFFSLILGAHTLIRYLLGHSLTGFTTVILLEVFILGFLMLTLGVISLYLSQIYTEIKRRPSYILKTEASETRK